MKKISALLMAVVLAFSLAACGGNDEPETTTTAPDTAETTESVNITENHSVDNTESVTAEETTTEEAVTDEAVSEEETSEAQGLDLNDKQAVLDYYNAAVRKTDKDWPKGQQTMKLSRDITGDGALVGMFVKMVTPIAKLVLNNNSSETDWVPGEGDLRLSDCESISATAKNGVVTVKIKLKSQVDGSDGDPHNGGPVARGIGTLGSIDEALSQLGITIDEGRETVALTYKNASLTANISEETGKITSGTWKYTVDIHVGDVVGSLKGISARITNIRSAVDYQVVI
ncbi:MAG: hypothetical protein IKK49_07940 [Clostridia bacterium]|nr:hypothetical protein [Clostridia bacterium]